MAASGALAEDFLAATLPPFQPGAFSGASIASIQGAFHFDTNNFLLPDPGESSLDYAELFSVLNDNAGPTMAGSSGAGYSAERSESGGAAASVPVAQARPAQRQPKEQQQPEAAQARRSDAKASRDVSSKRVRDNPGGKNKQQQVKELEALAAKKLEDLERLTRENDALKFRKQLLEKVVRMRDHQLKVISGGNSFLPEWCEPVPGATSSSSPALSASSSGAASGAGAGADAVCTPAPGGDGGSNGATRGRVLSAVEQIRLQSPGCALHAPGPDLPQLDRERFKSMGRLQFIETWKHFLAEVSVPLLAVESDPRDEAAAAGILQLVRKATFLFKHTSLLAADTVMMASQTHLETEALSPPEPSHWQNVVATLDLTPEQVAELRAVFGLFRDIMRAIVAERQAINQKLAAGSHGSLEDIQRAVESMTISPECQVLQALQRSMRREKAAHLLLRGFLFGNSLSVLQFAKVAVYSYPWMPDATALTATIADMGDAAAGSE